MLDVWSPQVVGTAVLCLVLLLVLALLLLGDSIAETVRDEIRKEWDDTRSPEQREAANRRAWWVGRTERFFFAFAAVVSPPVALGGVVGWAGLKLGANWGDQEAEEEASKDGLSPADRIRIHRMAALAATLASLGFAFAAGLLVRIALELVGGSVPW